MAPSAYGPLCTEFYDLDKPEAPSHELELYASYAARANGLVLEPMCGSGRFLVPLLARGFEIEGSDSSRHMLDACRRRAKAQRLEPVLHQQSLQDLDTWRRYGAILIPACSFSLVTGLEDVRTILARMNSALLPGGILAMDVVRAKDRPTEATPWQERSVRRADGATLSVTWQDRYVSGERVSTHTYRYQLLRGGCILDSESERISLRSYEPGELTQLLRAAGFDDIRSPDLPHSTLEDQECLVLECIAQPGASGRSGLRS